MQQPVVQQPPGGWAGDAPLVQHTVAAGASVAAAPSPSAAAAGALPGCTQQQVVLGQQDPQHLQQAITAFLQQQQGQGQGQQQVLYSRPSTAQSSTSGLASCYQQDPCAAAAGTSGSGNLQGSCYAVTAFDQETEAYLIPVMHIGGYLVPWVMGGGVREGFVRQDSALSALWRLPEASRTKAPTVMLNPLCVPAAAWLCLPLQVSRPPQHRWIMPVLAQQQQQLAHHQPRRSLSASLWGGSRRPCSVAPCSAAAAVRLGWMIQLFVWGLHRREQLPGCWSGRRLLWHGPAAPHHLGSCRLAAKPGQPRLHHQQPTLQVWVMCAHWTIQSAGNSTMWQRSSSSSSSSSSSRSYQRTRWHLRQV
jgi:hypothetical protein